MNLWFNLRCWDWKHKYGKCQHTDFIERNWAIKDLNVCIEKRKRAKNCNWDSQTGRIWEYKEE